MPLWDGLGDSGILKGDNFIIGGGPQPNSQSKGDFGEVKIHDPLT